MIFPVRNRSKWYIAYEFGEVEFKMFTVIFENLKVFYSIIISNFVYVVYNFFLRKKPIEVFLHYKAVLSNIAIFITSRMIWFFNNHISIGIFSNSTLPVKIIFHRKGFFFYPSFTSTLKRASNLVSFFRNFKLSFTNWTLFNRHYSHCNTQFTGVIR